MGYHQQKLKRRRKPHGPTSATHMTSPTKRVLLEVSASGLHVLFASEHPPMQVVTNAVEGAAEDASKETMKRMVVLVGLNAKHVIRPPTLISSLPSGLPQRPWNLGKQ